jgi:hypothetical protein
MIYVLVDGRHPMTNKKITRQDLRQAAGGEW